jgi:hypothetical protein
MSCVRNGVASAFSSRPLAASNIASKCAVGKPQPGDCCPLCPKCDCSTGVSGIEKLLPSIRNVRWPCHRPSAQLNRAAWQVRSTSRSSTARGKRIRASQYAAALHVKRASRSVCAQAVLPCNTCSRKAHTVCAGPSVRSRHEYLASRHACTIDASVRHSATPRLMRATAWTILDDMVEPLVGVFVVTHQPF